MKNLKRKFTNSTLLSNILLSPLSYTQKWENVEIVTLKQHAKDLATEQISTHSISNIDEQITQELTKSKYLKSKEFILIKDNAIKIGIQCDIINDFVVTKAMNLLMTIEKFTPGLYTFEHEYDICCANH